jgi:hypothetical protein
MATLLLQAAVGVAVSYGIATVTALLTPDQFNTNEGPRLKQSQITFAGEGDPVARHWGRNRLGGNIIWSTRLKETKQTDTTSNGGKGVTNKSTTENVSYTYSVSFAVAFCEGNDRTQLGRVWADGKLLDMTGITFRFYAGTETQTADTFITTVEGSGNVPAYRGIAYLVFEELQLADFGNRVPVITAEIIKGPATIDADELESVVRGVQLTPGAGEFIYGTRPYISDDGKGHTESQNVHNNRGVADLVRSLDVMDASAPAIDTVSLVVSWFGDDLRCGNNTCRPKVEFTTNKNVKPADWAAGGITSRASAVQISLDPNDRPYYGGTPSDVTVREAVIELKERGKRVQFYPFLLMDVPPGNTKTNPYTGAAGQPVFPWRGRITCNPAPGEPGTVDKTAGATTQIDSFCGSAAAGDFGAWDGETIPYTGPNEWSYRRFILHYAKLLSDLLEPGDIFIIGSEMVGLTQTRSSATAYPFVSRLVTLAGDVSGILGSGRLVGYAADWSEYHTHRPADGSGDVLFNMDPLWASADIDFVGIDNYLPMSDWRDGTDHLDILAGNLSIYSRDYLRSNVEGGEYFDWYYASDADRTDQVRTPISDGVYGEDWIFGNKNLRGWWESTHTNRPGGVQSSATSWVPEGKPIYFTEIGCPAVDKGTNQPNVFYDPKSSESFFPYFSSGLQDDLIQRRYIEETIGYWADNAPTSGVYADKMIKPENIFVWNWDARPYPEFPSRTDIWSDGGNWYRGHWLTGRLPLIPLSTLANELADFVGVAGVEINTDALLDVLSLVRGLTIDSIASPRDILELVGGAYFFDALSAEGVIKFSLRQYATTVTVSIDDLVVTDSEPGGYTLTRSQETELPAIAKVSFYDESNDYQVMTVDAVKQTGQSVNTITASYPVVMAEAAARAIPQIQIMEAWTARENGTVALPPSKLALDPGDVLDITIKGRAMALRISGFEVGEYRQAAVTGFDVANYGGLTFEGRQATIPVTPFWGSSLVVFLQIPLFTGGEARPWATCVVAYQEPWPGAVAVYRDDDNGGWILDTRINSRSPVGELAFDFYSGPTDYWDDVGECYVTIYSDDQLLGTTDLAVLNGANLMAIENADGGWEIMQFVNATLLSPNNYKLTRLLRGRGGSEHEMRNPVAAGARVVFLSSADVYRLNVPSTMLKEDVIFRYGPAPVPVDDFRYIEATVNMAGVGLKPLFPVQFDGVKDAGTGDWALSWVRRARPPITNDLGDEPLNEETELYELEILDTGVVVRTVSNLTSPAYAYTSTMQTADFGGSQTTLTFRVSQWSALYGWGEPGEETVYA